VIVMADNADLPNLDWIRIDGEAAQHYPAEVRRAIEVLNAYVAGLVDGHRMGGGPAAVTPGRSPASAAAGVAPVAARAQDSGEDDTEDHGSPPGAALRSQVETRVAASHAAALQSAAIGSIGNTVLCGPISEIGRVGVPAHTGSVPASAREILVVWGRGANELIRKSFR
jgi:hypothetical protein